MPTVNLPSGVVHYVELGQGVPLILLHANPGDSSDFEAVIPALAQHYRVLALDWPGYGRSAVPDQLKVVSAHFFYNILREFLKALALPPALFIGNSLGGKCRSTIGDRVARVGAGFGARFARRLYASQLHHARFLQVSR
jgi:pimeloyl-ACP methyl ester carboxylesterase